MTDETPELSIVLTVADGGAALRRCLDALKGQVDPPVMEVIVPFDASFPEVAAMASDYPGFAFLDLGRLSAKPPSNAFEIHALMDICRSAGLHRARGALIAMIEDRGWPKADWARRMIQAHRQFPDGAIGGAVESGAESLARWAIFFLDYGRYQAPFETEHPDYVTDTNICYKRDALMSAEHLWRAAYRESEVNWHIRDAGHGLRLAPGPRTVQQRAPVGLIGMALERMHWARIFGQVRAHGASFGARLKWCLIAPLLPAVLYLRHLRRQMRIGRHRLKFVLATPFMLYLLLFWSIGELIGTLEPDRKEKPA